MSHPRTSSSLPANGVGSPVTVDGITYVWNTVTGRWETQISKNINIVTKDTDANYVIPLSSFSSPLASKEGQFAAHKPNEELLTVIEVDTNFIQLKQGIASLERELTYWTHEIEEETARINTINTTLFDSNNQVNFVPRTTGGTFGGIVSASTPTSSNQNNSDLVTTQYLQREFGTLNRSLIPSQLANNLDLGSSSNGWRDIYVQQSILPDSSANIHATETRTDPSNPSQQVTVRYRDVDIGSFTNRFRDIFAHEVTLFGGTLNIGDASLSETTSGGLLIPNNSSIGTEANEIPSSFANTLIDERFATTGQASERLVGTFLTSASISANDPVKILSNGKVVTVTSTTSSDAFIGIALETKNANLDIKVAVHGVVGGFSGLTSGTTVHVEQNGTITQTKTTTTQKIGVAVSTTEIFLFSISNLDTYVLGRSKIDLEDLSASVVSPASGSGNFSYNNTTGTFSFTPPDLSPYATTQYVNQQVAGLIDSAPGALDTLNELAAAIGDDANFSTTVTNSLATKAPLADPAFTGTPTAPTASSTTNNTQIATTAFVQSLAGAQEIGDLSDVNINNIQDGQVLAYSISSQKFVNQNQSGIGSGTGGTVNFIVDGGTATTVSNDIIIFLDGGSA
jgi:hypothetical protein|tara:strand:+ start:1373 stop:3250 length:1878 start_codon:yes stop_codon:yes gene_type:complete